jgi:hypothetical protein
VGRDQSAGYARRRHIRCDRGRGFDSRRLHWFAPNGQSGHACKSRLLWSGICCDMGDIVCWRSSEAPAIESRLGMRTESEASRSAAWVRTRSRLLGAATDSCAGCDRRHRHREAPDRGALLRPRQRQSLAAVHQYGSHSDASGSEERLAGQGAKREQMPASVVPPTPCTTAAPAVTTTATATKPAIGLRREQRPGEPSVACRVRTRGRRPKRGPRGPERRRTASYRSGSDSSACSVRARAAWRSRSAV